ncbi:MAG: TA system VapC family ribonuclease toxin [Verrucomicrobiota bacterium]
MILPDLNVLLYAYNPHTPQHQRAVTWWQACLNGDELIGLPNEVCLGFVRIATNQRLGKAAVGISEARAIVEQWVQQPQTRILQPAADHFTAVMDLMESAMASGALVSDAVLAAYAIANRATLYSNDADFSRFCDLDWKNPLL